MTNIIDELQTVLERLEHHLDDIHLGSLTARDDLASVLQLLVGDGTGYRLIARAFDELGLRELAMPAFSKTTIDRTFKSENTHLAVRAINIADNRKLPLSQMVEQEVILHDGTVWNIEKSINWKRIISNARNNLGSHIGESQPAWLNDIKYYPASNADIITLLLMSFGEALLESITSQLGSSGQPVMTYIARHDLNGIVFQESFFTLTNPTKINVDVLVKVVDEHTKKRTLIGAINSSRPFLLGLDTHRVPVVVIGSEGQLLEQLEHEFITGQNPTGLNRAQRRAARK